MNELLVALMLLLGLASDDFLEREQAEEALVELNNERDWRVLLRLVESAGDPEVSRRLRRVLSAYKDVGHLVPRIEFLAPIEWDEQYEGVKWSCGVYSCYDVYEMADPRKMYESDQRRREAGRAWLGVLFDRGMTRQEARKLIASGMKKERRCGRIPVPKPKCP